MTLASLLGVAVPIIQAPMAGVQKSRLAIAVSRAGGLGSLPCAMLDAATIRSEVEAIRTATAAPFNLNFFCHAEPVADPGREQRWRTALAPFYAEFGIDLNAQAPAVNRAPFDAVSREPDPELLLRGYERAALTLNFVLPRHKWIRISPTSKPASSRSASGNGTSSLFRTTCSEVCSQRFCRASNLQAAPLSSSTCSSLATKRHASV